MVEHLEVPLGKLCRLIEEPGVHQRDVERSGMHADNQLGVPYLIGIIERIRREIGAMRHAFS